MSKIEPRLLFQCYETIIEYADALGKSRRKYDDLPGRFVSDTLNGLVDKLITHTCRIVVSGEFKRGKSSFINAILGDFLLPEAVAPETAIQTKICFSEREWINVTTKEGQIQPISRTQMKDWLTQHGSQSHRVLEAEIGYPSSFLLDNDAVFIDTPGLNDSEAMDKRTFEAVVGADVIIYMLSSSSPFSDTEREYFKKIFNISPDAFFLFVMNKIDTVDEDDREKLLDTTQKRILETIQTHPEYGALKENIALFPCSSRDALISRKNGDHALLWASGIPQLYMHLKNIVVSANQHRHLEKIIKVLNKQIETSKKGCEDALTDWSRKVHTLTRCHILMNTLMNFYVSEHSNRILQAALEAGNSDISHLFQMTSTLKSNFEPLIRGKGYGLMNECCSKANNAILTSFYTTMEKTQKKLDDISDEWRDAFINKYNDIVTLTGDARLSRSDLKPDEKSFQPPKLTFGMLDFPTLAFKRSADTRRKYIYDVIEHTVQTCCSKWVSLCELWASKFRATMNQQSNALISNINHRYEKAADCYKANIIEMKESEYYMLLTQILDNVQALMIQIQES